MTEEKKSLFWYRVKFLSLVGVFVLPFFAGWMALYVFELKPESDNYGKIIQPVKKLSWPKLESINGQIYEGGFGKKWTFLLFTQGACNDRCRSNIYYMRQIRTLLGRDTERLQNVLISAAAMDETMLALLREYPDFVVIDGFRNNRLLAQFAEEEGTITGTTPRLYLVDPDQNYMMVYPAEIDEYRVLEDIKKLMKLSQIG